MDLIFAEATPSGRGGVSIIRISGNGARHAVEDMTGPLPEPRHAYFRDISFGDDLIDSGLVIWFEEGRSFTGEEIVEFHLHGAPVITRRVAHILSSKGLRLAEAGEFTRRAFLNGRLDLSEVEGLGDLLVAETEMQRRAAMRTSTGELSRKADGWRTLLIRAGALVESSVDFADEDVPEAVPEEVFHLLAEFRADLDREIGGYTAAERIRNGFEVAIIGSPNVGKSSFLNALARREVALVSDIAGTTRDVIELRIDLCGLAVTLLDTAGLRPSLDPVECLGIDRARTRAVGADLRLHLSPTGEIVEDLWESGDMVVITKADDGHHDGGLSISSLNGIGIDEFLSQLFMKLSERITNASLVSHDRQLRALMRARAALEDTKDLAPEFLAESIRIGAQSLDQLIGKIGAEDYLSIIFSSFCIGK